MPLAPTETPARGMLRIGDKAPDFAARSTEGPIRSERYRGRWLLLFAHPADFTPVCTSEFIALARAAPQFEAAECQLLAISVDSLHSHLAWLRDIEDHLGIRIPFPVIEDPSMEIARAYGMLDQTAASSATVRASFVIDPAGTVRAITWYPMQVGRSVAELLRLVRALQQSDAEAASTPEGWVPGGELLEPGALTYAEACSRSPANGLWYLAGRR